MKLDELWGSRQLEFKAISGQDKLCNSYLCYVE
jgi:hypothetical protein